MEKKENKIILSIFLFTVFLIKLPPFYIIPYQSKIFTTHTFSKFILLIIFFYFLGKQIFNKNESFNFNDFVIKIPLLFLLSQIISGLLSIDIYFYLTDAHNFFFAFLIFIESYFILKINKNNIKVITDFMFITGVVLVFCDLIYFLTGQTFLNIIKILLEKDSFPVYQINLDRGRFNLYLNTEIFFSFFFLFFFIKKRKITKFFIFIIIILLFFLTYISNFRYRLLFLTMEIFFLLLFRKNFRFKTISYILIGYLFLLFLNIFIVRTYHKYDLIDRLMMDNVVDYNSVYYRIESFKKAVELFRSSPLLGVGLGNYKIYVNDQSQFFNYDRIKITLNKQSTSDPHSILSKTLSESGIIGIIAFLNMIFFFFKRDFIFIKKYNNNKLFFILPYLISFWAYFVIILFTPSITLFRGGWFWFLRGIIDGYYYHIWYKSA